LIVFDTFLGVDTMARFVSCKMYPLGGGGRLCCGLFDADQSTGGQADVKVWDDSKTGRGP